MLSVEKIQKNWDLFIDKISKLKSGILTDFYLKYEERFSTMPASGNKAFHNAFVGGYIDHVLRVNKLATEILAVWMSNGAKIDFTQSELEFVALNHDLGKFGDEEHEYYVSQDSDWHYKRGEIYKHNPSLHHMNTPDRTLFILQDLQVPLTKTEYLSIKLHDGLYDESNKGYLVSYSDEKRLFSNLPYIIHQADLTATRIEYDLFHNESSNSSKKSVIKQEEPVILKATTTEKKSVKTQGKYSDLLNKIK